MGLLPRSRALTVNFRLPVGWAKAGAGKGCLSQQERPQGWGRGHRASAASQHLTPRTPLERHQGLPQGLQVPAPHTIPRQSAGPRSASVLGPRAPKLCPPPTAHQAYPPVTAPARVRDQPKRTCGTRTLSPRAVGRARRPAPDPYTATRHGDPGSEVGNPRGPESPHPGKPAMTVSGVRADRTHTSCRALGRPALQTLSPPLLLR